MRVLGSIAAVFVAAAAVPAAAQGYYTAQPKGEIAASSVVTRSTVWKCAGATCVANRAPERDAVLCELLAKRVGALETFSVGGAAFDEAALAKCNARAR